MPSTETLALFGAITGGLGMVLAVVALGWDVYKWRADKKPKLEILMERDFVKAHRTDEVGGVIYYPVPGLKIYAGNSTEHPIKVKSIRFLDTKHCYHALPADWGTLHEVPARDGETFEISLTNFNKWVEDIKLHRPEEGRFVITDTLKYEYKTARVGITSLEPVEKLKTGISLD